MVIEADEMWAERIRAGGVTDVTIAASAEVVRHVLAELGKAGARFGVVLVDGVEPRSEYLEDAARLVSEDGLLVVDNSDRERYGAALASLHDWHRFDFFGLGPQNAYAWATSIFSRQAVAPRGRRESFKRSIEY